MPGPARWVLLVAVYRRGWAEEAGDGDSASRNAGEAGSAGPGLADGGLWPGEGAGPVVPGPKRGGLVYGVAGAGFLAGADEPDRMARAALGYLADPGDQVLGALLRYCTAAQVVAALVAGQHPLALAGAAAAALPGSTAP